MPPSLLSRLSSLRTRSKPEAPKTHITDGPALPKTEIGSAKDVLEDELLRLYWDGVKQDLPYIISTMRNYLSSKSIIPEGEDIKTEGYDTWVDNITRGSAISNEPLGGPQMLDIAMHRHAWDILKDVKQGRLKENIRSKVREPSADLLKQRARLLLQSAQWLDIDKLIEHRDPPPGARLSPANLETEMSKVIPPGFESRRCHECHECHEILRGPEYSKIKMDSGFRKAHPIVCEKCYCDNHYGEEGFRKKYKNSSLPSALRNEKTLKACKCNDIWSVGHESPSKSTPEIEQHLNPRCPVGKMRNSLADSKFESTRLPTEKGKSFSDYQKLHAEQDLKRAVAQWKEGRKLGPKPTLGVRLEQEVVAELGLDGVPTDSPFNQAPEYLRPASSSNPWGSIHMALRIGPLVIENGVENVNGVLISTRKAPELLSHAEETDFGQGLVLEDTSMRTVFSQDRPRGRRRYKGTIKQVVGGGFCRFLDEYAEDDLIEGLIELAKEPAPNQNEKGTGKSETSGRFWTNLKDYLEPNAKFYISSIARQLLGTIDIIWNQHFNNCRNFCNNLLDEPMFKRIFVPKPPTGGISANPERPYLISFVNNETSLHAVKPSNKNDVPNGFVEEFLLRIRSGRYEASDMFESLLEYWYEWGCLEQPMYNYQDIFPWDCTEAYHDCPTTCGDCSLSKHVWTAPFDAWSLISLHLTRSRFLYPKHAFPATVKEQAQKVSLPGAPLPSSREEHQAPHLENGLMSDKDWNDNRLTVLRAQAALLTAATAMASSPAFMNSISHFARPEPELDRIKLGGLHRAQPYSHHFEKGAYRRFYVADWTNQNLQLRVREYEHLRDKRADMADVDEEKHMVTRSYQVPERKYQFAIKVPSDVKFVAEDFHGLYGQNWPKHVEPPPVPESIWPACLYNRGGGQGVGGQGVGGTKAGGVGPHYHGRTKYYLAVVDEDKDRKKGRTGGGGSSGGDDGGCGGCGGCGG